MEKSNWLKKKLTSFGGPKKKEVFVLSQDREWVLVDEKKSNHTNVDTSWAAYDSNLRSCDFKISWLGLPSEAFVSYSFFNKTQEVEYSLLKINLLYQGDKNYMYQMLTEAAKKGISGDMVIEILNEENEVVNTVVLGEAKIYTIEMFTKLKKNKKRAICAKVLIMHNERTIN